MLESHMVQETSLSNVFPERQNPSGRIYNRLDRNEKGGESSNSSIHPHFVREEPLATKLNGGVRPAQIHLGSLSRLVVSQHVEHFHRADPCRDQCMDRGGQNVLVREEKLLQFRIHLLQFRILGTNESHVVP